MQAEMTGTFISISDHEFDLIAAMVYEKTGIRLGVQKKSLVETRLGKLIRQLGFTSFGEYHNYILNDKTGAALALLIEKISTNHSYFFRESDHFSYLRETALPEIMKQADAAGRRSLRIWCAGCAGGEESYTLAMILDDISGAAIERRDVGILATDISLGVLQKARTGIYPREKIQALPEAFREKYFTRYDSESVMVCKKLRDMILHKQLNLAEYPYPFKGKFDIVFCRNVMIYFDAHSREKTISNIAASMHEGGYLFIGHSESLGREHTTLRYIKPAVYRKVPEGGAHG